MKGFTAEIYAGSFIDAFSPMKEAKNVTIIDPMLPEFYEPTPQAPGVKLVRRYINGNLYIHAEPMEPGSYAFGGRFIYCSDGRFREINKYPIPLHDRDMSKEI